MDVEKTIGFLLGQQARFDAQMGLLTEKMDYAADRALAMDERHDREMADLRDSLRRAVRLSTEEHRRERVRRQALDEKMAASQRISDEKMAQLAASQLISDEKMTQLAASQLISDEKMTQLAASQILTDERFQKLINALLNRNGKG